ncbi:MAG: flagellin lysine-N-methylase, partial [Cellulosilyticaceae bacterium]
MEKKVAVIQPQYVSEFNCTGSACQNNCCQGWKITIDETTYKQYKRIKHPGLVGKISQIKRIRSSDNHNTYGQFKLVNGACPMLNEQGLCEIYATVGPEYMCTTCQQFPRQYTSYQGMLNKGLSLACEEVARLLFKNKDPLAFDIIAMDVKFDKITKINLDDTNLFGAKREALITIMQNRNYPIWERLVLVGMICEQLDENENEAVLAEFVQEVNQNRLVGLSDEIVKRVDLQLMSYQHILAYYAQNR